MKPLNILYLVRHRGMHSGSAKQLFYLAKEMAEKGHQITCLFSHSPKNPCDFASLKIFSPYPILVETINMDRFYYPPSIIRLHRYLKKNQFDVVHAFKGGALNSLLLASIGIKIPAVIFFRGVSFPFDFWSSLKFRWAKIDHIIAISASIKKQLLAQNILTPQQISVVHGVEDPAQYHPRPQKPCRESLQIPIKSTVVSLLANIGGWKGHRYFFDSVPFFLNSSPDILIWCVGRGDAQQFAPQLKQLGIEQSVRFSPFIEKFEMAIAAVDISVCASYQGEGITGVVVASMAMRKAIITTDVGGNKEIIINEETGLVVPAKDPESLGLAIKRLIENPDLATRLADNAYQYYLQHLQPASAAQKVEQIYRTYTD